MLKLCLELVLLLLESFVPRYVPAKHILHCSPLVPAGQLEQLLAPSFVSVHVPIVHRLQLVFPISDKYNPELQVKHEEDEGSTKKRVEVIFDLMDLAGLYGFRVPFDDFALCYGTLEWPERVNMAFHESQVVCVCRYVLPSMVVTWDTSHLERSLVNCDAI